MKSIASHLSRCVIAGIVALLPIGSLVLTVVYLEKTIAAAWPKDTFYFPGLGLVAAVVLIYLVGLTISTFIGQWLWRAVDSLLNRLPALGAIYQTLKQLLGYGAGEQAIFREVVLVPCKDFAGHEIGLVTNRVVAEDGSPRLVVFLPGAPNPTSGRLLLLEPSVVRPINVPVSDAMKTLVSVGKTPIKLSP